MARMMPARRWKSLVVAVAASIVLACGGASPSLPSIDAPNFDRTAVEGLLREAIAEVDRLAASPPAIELPADLATLLDQSGVTLPPVPSNAAEICQALGTPGLAGATGAGLGALLESFASVGELGLVAGLLVTVVFSTCPVWSPHLETALRELL